MMPPVKHRLVGIAELKNHADEGRPTDEYFETTLVCLCGEWGPKTHRSVHLIKQWNELGWDWQQHALSLED